MVGLMSGAYGAVATGLVPNAVEEGRTSLVGVGSREKGGGRLLLKHPLASPRRLLDHSLSHTLPANTFPFIPDPKVLQAAKTPEGMRGRRESMASEPGGPRCELQLCRLLRVALHEPRCSHLSHGDNGCVYARELCGGS